MELTSNKKIFLEKGDALNTPVFFKPWWLDVVCKKGSWEVCISQDKSGKILGVLPYFVTVFLGFKLIRTPPLTPYLGIWLDYSECSNRNTNRYGFEVEVIENLLKQLPKVAWYHQIHPEQLQNWLPFYWQGYKQTTRYTYVFEALDLEKIWEGMRDDVRNKLRKAEKSGLTVRKSDDFDGFIRTLKNTFDRHQVPFFENFPIFISLHEEIQRRCQGAIYMVEDNTGAIHAAIYLVWDAETAYCWQLGTDPTHNKNGAAQLLIWHSIQLASKMVKRYNFEGSMLPHIEPVFRAFGAERKAVFQIRKFGNRLLEAIRILLKG
jgi:hypothetical protein